MIRRYLLLSVFVTSCAFAIPASGQTMKDPRDGKEYSTTKIGSKVWMAQNLAYVQPLDTYDIQMGLSAETKQYTRCYDSDLKNCDQYGMLYSWKTAQYVCPTGWHLPSKEEADSLIVALGKKNEQYINLTRFWNEEGMLGGRLFVPEYNYSSRYPSWHSNGLRKYGTFWTSTGARVQFKYWLIVNRKKKSVKVNVFGGNSGASVRCVKNDLKK
jgi:uncharacterized protein (TIGR02145 family)